MRYVRWRLGQIRGSEAAAACFVFKNDFNISKDYLQRTLYIVLSPRSLKEEGGTERCLGTAEKLTLPQKLARPSCRLLSVCSTKGVCVYWYLVLLPLAYARNEADLYYSMRATTSADFSLAASVVWPHSDTSTHVGCVFVYRKC